MKFFFLLKNDSCKLAGVDANSSSIAVKERVRSERFSLARADIAHGEKSCISMHLS